MLGEDAVKEEEVEASCRAALANEGDAGDDNIGEVAVLPCVCEDAIVGSMRQGRRW